MYNGKHDLQITVRCASCKAVTVAELDYEVEQNVFGKRIAETIPEVECGRCSKVAFKRSRFDFMEVSMAAEEEKKKPESTVLEVQSLRHEINFTIKGNGQEAKNGKKHT